MRVELTFDNSQISKGILLLSAVFLAASFGLLILLESVLALRLLLLFAGGMLFLLWWNVGGLARHPTWLYALLLLLMTVVPIFQGQREGLALRDVFRAMEYGLAAFLILLAVRQHRIYTRTVIRLQTADFFLLGMLAWQFLAVFRTTDIRDTLLSAIANNIVIFSCMYALRLFISQEPRIRESLFTYWCGIGTLVATASWLFILIGPINVGGIEFGNYANRGSFSQLSSIYLSGNTAGPFLYIGLISTIVQWRLFTAPRHRMYLLFCAVLIASALIGTFSRSSLLGAVIGGILVYMKGISGWRRAVNFVALLAAAGLAYQFVSADVDLAYAFKLNSGLSRRDEIWRLYAKVLQESPWVGQGAVSVYYWQRVGGQYVQELITTHNSLLGLTVRSGFVGLSLFLTACVLMIRAAFSQMHVRSTADSWLAWGGLCLFLTIFAQQLFESRLFSGLDYTHASFWCALTVATTTYVDQMPARN